MTATPKLLWGGNPQIPKGDGDVPVQAYIAAMPGWKRDLGRRLDALIVRNVPDDRKAVRWRSPSSGAEKAAPISSKRIDKIAWEQKSSEHGRLPRLHRSV